MSFKARELPVNLAIPSLLMIVIELLPSNSRVNPNIIKANVNPRPVPIASKILLPTFSLEATSKALPKIIQLTVISGNYDEEGVKRELFSSFLPNINVITVQYGLVKASVVPNPQLNILVDDEPRYCNAWNSYGEDDTAVLFIPNHSNLEKNIVNDLLDIPNTQAYKKLIKTRNS